MNLSHEEMFTAFLGSRKLYAGPLAAVALEVKRTKASDSQNLLIFNDRSGKTIDIDIRGSDEDILERFAPKVSEAIAVEEQRGRGRPKLGVVAREVTLLPRHWEWLNTQPGGASVALRKLVEEARAKNHPGDQIRQSREAAYYFMSAIAGDFPGFEEAARALFSGNRERFDSLVTGWPTDIRNHAANLGFAAS